MGLASARSKVRSLSLQGTSRVCVFVSSILGFKLILSIYHIFSCVSGTKFDIVGSSAAGQYDFGELGCSDQPTEYSKESGSKNYSSPGQAPFDFLFIFQATAVVPVMRASRLWWVLTTHLQILLLFSHRVLTK